MKLLIKYPTRARWDTFKKTLGQYMGRLSNKHEVEFVISMDVDDRSMNNPEVHAYLDALKNVSYCYGENRTKVEAINANMQNHEFDVVLLASDDMIPEVDGYDDIICSALQEYFPDTDGVLHFHDGRVGESLNTLSIMGKKMYDRFGYIYHPDYKSLWCDNEFHEVTRAMGKVKWIDRVIIRHAWVDATGQDGLHRHNESFHNVDKRTYDKRKSLGFPKEAVMVHQPERVSRDPRRRYSGKATRSTRRP